MPPVCHLSSNIEVVAFMIRCERGGYKGSERSMGWVGSGRECDLRVRNCGLGVVFVG